jgi:hypothetical protein
MNQTEGGMVGAWTPQRIEKLTELWAREWSCSRIVGELNADSFALLPPLSRNGVIGKLHRLGLVLPAEEVRRRKGWKHLPPDDLAAKREKIRRIHQDRAERRNQLQSSMTLGRPATRSMLRPVKLVSLVDLEGHMCRFPYEWTAEDPSPDGLTYGYCGARVPYEGCSWCARHLRLVSGEPSETSRARSDPHSGRRVPERAYA